LYAVEKAFPTKDCWACASGAAKASATAHPTSFLFIHRSPCLGAFLRPRLQKCSATITNGADRTIYPTHLAIKQQSNNIAARIWTISAFLQSFNAELMVHE
jgi:hypothetical protein